MVVIVVKCGEGVDDVETCGTWTVFILFSPLIYCYWLSAIASILGAQYSLSVLVLQGRILK